ncbi:hypothetical protein K2X83_00270 [Patescibacteria group bacterium]|nr:hypothetical protein [Patescibacteria group bacterium]
MSLESIIARLSQRIGLPGGKESMTEEEIARKAVIDFGVYEMSRGGGWKDEWVRGPIKPEDKAVALLEITNHIYGFAIKKSFKEGDLQGLAEETLTEMRRRVSVAMTPRGRRK